MIDSDKYKKIIEEVSPFKEIGQVTHIIGLVIEADGPSSSIGDLCYIYSEKNKEPVCAEVVGFKEEKILLMPLGEMEGLRPGATVVNSGGAIEIKAGSELLGRVLDGLGKPIDEYGAIRTNKTCSINSQKINPLLRKKLKNLFLWGLNR